jgi:hypothetical protein
MVTTTTDDDMIAVLQLRPHDCVRREIGDCAGRGSTLWVLAMEDVLRATAIWSRWCVWRCGDFPRCWRNFPKARTALEYRYAHTTNNQSERPQSGRRGACWRRGGDRTAIYALGNCSLFASAGKSVIARDTVAEALSCARAKKEFTWRRNRHGGQAGALASWATSVRARRPTTT